MNPWFFLQSGACPAAFNMALDEALLEASAHIGKPVLRFYGWTEPAATFGYFQKYADVERVTFLRPLIRRPTGGGIVPHNVDWTYSLTFPPSHEWHFFKAEESYRRVHEWIQSAFAKLNIATELALRSQKFATRNSLRRSLWRSLGPKSEIGQCFIGYTKFDLLWNGEKIAGAAQRRNKLGLLIQGSVQLPPVSPSRADWGKAMVETARRDFDVAWTKFSPDAKLRSRVDELVCEKYSQETYNRKR
jgi:lipoate-protein ligase A